MYSVPELYEITSREQLERTELNKNACMIYIAIFAIVNEIFYNF